MESRTLVLFGRTGNGKSATGNSILRKPAFKSGTSLSGVTTTAEIHSTALPTGEIVNVIDTPGVFDFNEIEQVLDLAKSGIHAVLLVLSIKGRFSEEEFKAIERLQNLFGPKINEYLIVVFTGSLEDESLDEYLSSGPEPLQVILKVCKNRSVLFDNKAKDEGAKAMQLQELLNRVDEVMTESGGHPYTNNLYAEFRVEAAKLGQLKGEKERDLYELNVVVEKSYNENRKRMTGMGQVVSKLEATSEMLTQQLADERAARSEAEQDAQNALRASEEEVRMLRQRLDAEERNAGRGNGLGSIVLKFLEFLQTGVRKFFGFFMKPIS